MQKNATSKEIVKFNEFGLYILEKIFVKNQFTFFWDTGIYIKYKQYVKEYINIFKIFIIII